MEVGAASMPGDVATSPASAPAPAPPATSSSHHHHHPSTSARSTLSHAVAGASAGVIAATFVCSLDVIKTRFQVHGWPKLAPGTAGGRASAACKMALSFGGGGCRGKWWLTVRRKQHGFSPEAMPWPAKIQQWKEALGREQWSAGGVFPIRSSVNKFRWAIYGKDACWGCNERPFLLHVFVSSVDKWSYIGRHLTHNNLVLYAEFGIILVLCVCPGKKSEFNTSSDKLNYGKLAN